MRVLIAHKLWYVKGGVERYVIGLRRMLTEHGHEAIPFTCAHPSNEPTGYERFHPPYRDLSSPRIDREAITAAANFFYSREARSAVSRLLDETRPDIVHCRNIYHHLSPSILAEFERRGIPVVMTMADYKLVCPNYKLFRDGRVCEECKGGRYARAIEHRCVKGSRAASALCAAEAWFHDTTGAYVNRLDKILAPSRFARDVLADHGIPADKLGVLPHFLDLSEWQPQASQYSGRPYIVTFGRLSDEKGVDVAIRAIGRTEGVDLVIAGEGPMEASLRDLAEEVAPGRVRFLGYRDSTELRRIIADSLAVVMPSIWYEVFGFSILESFALAKPVLGSRIGAIPELVEDGETGLTFAVGDADELAAQIDALVRDPASAQRMGTRARQVVEERYSAPRHYESLMAIYGSLVKAV